MYDDHYGLSGRPFQLTPDPRFWFDTATHRKAMAYLGYGLSQGEGFIVITGDVGAGKTTLVGHLMATVDRERLNIIKIVSTQIEADDLLRMVAGGLDIDTAGLNKSQLLTAIERGLHATARGGRRTLLIVDEAQALPVSALEELRMLSNFQAGGHAILQIFLLGQPEFRERLHGSDRLEQLRQRVIAMHHLDPMGPEEVEPYMVHRLSVVGWQGRPYFTPDAFQALYHGSDGVPRRLNQLAGRVLLFGAIEQLDTIDARVVEAVLADIAGDSPVPKPVIRQPIPPQPQPVVQAEPELAPEPVEAAGPMPIVHTPAPSVSRPIRMVREPGVPAVDTADEQILPVADKELPADDQMRAIGDRAQSIGDQVLFDRIVALEERVEEQEVALRRVLTLLVDWVEGDARPDADSVRHAAGR
ncbi:AAA family ATPase [Sphingomonas sp. So64.6b]|uniref:ExeA family protein n=1 Tax=Sphingomonas sp. So64.6b TaxID=2997354 RepID=UPI00160302CF|nr:AAA family ATPase [Sphingomonas sp. So64.6b]QNA84086.1 AAA family ATPase [Sphingomonas sp. So64.6b]